VKNVSMPVVFGKISKAPVVYQSIIILQSNIQVVSGSFSADDNSAANSAIGGGGRLRSQSFSRNEQIIYVYAGC